MSQPRFDYTKDKVSGDSYAFLEKRELMFLLTSSRALSVVTVGGINDCECMLHKFFTFAIHEFIG